MTIIAREGGARHKLRSKGIQAMSLPGRRRRRSIVMHNTHHLPRMLLLLFRTLLAVVMVFSFIGYCLFFWIVFYHVVFSFSFVQPTGPKTHALLK